MSGFVHQKIGHSTKGLNIVA